MKDRLPTKVLENGAIRYGVYDEEGNLLRYEYIKAEDDPTQLGTPLNKKTLLQDETAQAIGLSQPDPTVDDAFSGLQNNVDSLFQSVSDGKALVASAITDKGVATAPDATFKTMSGNIKKISTIPPNVHLITLNAKPSHGGSVAGGGYASKNMKVQVDASPAKDYKFTAWKKGNSIVSSNANYIFQVSADANLTAEFEQKKLVEWASTTLPFSTERLSAKIAYGNGKFVVVSNGKAAYSTDGVTWHPSNIQNALWLDVCFGGGKFVAVANGGKIAYSTDGITWTLATNVPSVNFKCVTYGNGKFFAAGDSATGDRDLSAAYSTDGANWHIVSMPRAASSSSYSLEWGSAAYGNGMFIAFPTNANNNAYSSDGVNWSLSNYPVTSSLDIHGNAIYDGLKFVFAGHTGISWSDDGKMWFHVPGSGDNHIWEDVAYGNGVLVSVGWSEEVGYSEDGETWEYESLGAPGVEHSGVVFGAEKFVIVGDGGKVLYSVS